MTGIERMNLGLAVEFVNNGFDSMTDAGKVIFVKTCADLGIKIAEPITKAEFERASGVIAKMAGDNALEEMAASKEIAFGEKARKFAEASKEKLEKGFEFAVENIDTVKEEVTSMANMPPELLENYLKGKAKKGVKKIADSLKGFASKERENAKKNPAFAEESIENAEKAESLLVLIKQIMDDENKSGWGKFVSIITELAKWILNVLLKVGAVILKIGCTVVVGAIKIGAATLVSAGAVASAAYKYAFKPVFKGGKKVVKKVKDKAANIKAAMEEDDFDDFEDDFFDDEELYVVDEQ